MSKKQEEQSFEDAFDELAEGVDSSADEPVEPTEETEDGELQGQEEAQEQAELLEDPADETEEDPSEPEPQDEVAALRAELQQWQHRYNSDLGRQNAYQRQLQEKDQLIAQMQKSNQAKNPGISNDRWKVVSEDYPDIAEGVKALFEEQKQQHEMELQRVRAELQPIQQQAHQTYIDQQFDLLEREHPDYREIAASQDFKSWVAMQPQNVQQMITSEQAGDAAYLLRAYKNDVQPGQQASSELKQRREKQLRQAQTVPSRGGRAQTQMPPDDDFEAAFDFFASRD